MQTKKGQMNEQSRQDMSCINRTSKIYPLSVKNKHEVDYFIAGPGKEADMAESA